MVPTLVVCRHNLSNQTMAYNITTGQLHNSNPLNLAQPTDGVNDARGDMTRKVDLCFIAVHHDAGALSHPGEEHLHLGDGRILSFIENDERVVECSPA